MFPLSAFQRNELRTQGLQEKEMKPDGNCFYRAVAHHCLGNQNKHMVVRKATIKFFRKNKEKFIPSMDTGSNESSGTIDEFLHNNALSGTFANDHMIVACCQAWQLDLHIIADTKDYSRHYELGANKVIVLYKDGIHYDTAVPRTPVVDTLRSGCPPLCAFAFSTTSPPLSPASMSLMESLMSPSADQEEDFTPSKSHLDAGTVKTLPVRTEPDAVTLPRTANKNNVSRFAPYSARNNHDMLWKQLCLLDHNTQIVYNAETDCAKPYIADRRQTMHGWTIGKLLETRPFFPNTRGVMKRYNWQDWKYDVKWFQLMVPEQVPEQVVSTSSIMRPNVIETSALQSTPTSVITDEMCEASLAAVGRLGDGNTKGDTLFDDSDSDIDLFGDMNDDIDV